MQALFFNIDLYYLYCIHLVIGKSRPRPRLWKPWSYKAIRSLGLGFGLAVRPRSKVQDQENFAHHYIHPISTGGLSDIREFFKKFST